MFTLYRFPIVAVSPNELEFYSYSWENDFATAESLLNFNDGKKDSIIKEKCMESSKNDCFAIFNYS